MGQAKNRKAEIDALKAKGPKPNVIKGTGFKFKPHNLGGGMSGIMFDYKTEFQKAVSMILSDPLPYDTKSTRADYRAMSFGNAGFLLALVPVRNLLGGVARGFLSKTQDADTVKNIVSEFSVEYLSDDWALFKTYITRDIAFDKFERLHSVLHTAFIAYSTPEYIGTLSEDKDFMLAYRDNKDPMTVLDFA